MKKNNKPTNRIAGNAHPISKNTAKMVFKFYATLDEEFKKLYSCRQTLVLFEAEGVPPCTKLSKDFTVLIEKIEALTKEFHLASVEKSPIQLEELYEEMFEALKIEVIRLADRHEKKIAEVETFPECTLCYGKYDPAYEGSIKYFKCTHVEWHGECIKNMVKAKPNHVLYIRCPMCRAYWHQVEEEPVEEEPFVLPPDIFEIIDQMVAGFNNQDPRPDPDFNPWD